MLQMTYANLLAQYRRGFDKSLSTLKPAERVAARKALAQGTHNLRRFVRSGRHSHADASCQNLEDLTKVDVTDSFYAILRDSGGENGQFLR